MKRDTKSHLLFLTEQPIFTLEISRIAEEQLINPV